MTDRQRVIYNINLEREKELKKWKRSWKIRLIEEANPDWRDLWFDIRQSF